MTGGWLGGLCESPTGFTLPICGVQGALGHSLFDPFWGELKVSQLASMDIQVKDFIVFSLNTVKMHIFYLLLEFAFFSFGWHISGISLL